jgi:hypothetical protein
MPPSWRRGEPGFSLRTRASPVAPDPSSAPSPKAGATHSSATSRTIAFDTRHRDKKSQISRKHKPPPKKPISAPATAVR